MACYVDGFVICIPTRKIEAYRKMSATAGKVWIKHGALDYKECVGDDLNTKFGVPFPKQMSAKKGETVVFAFITFKSRAHRDKVNGKVMKDPEMDCGGEDMKDMPFDPERMVYGGFKSIVDMTPKKKKAK